MLMSQIAEILLSLEYIYTVAGVCQEYYTFWAIVVQKGAQGLGRFYIYTQILQLQLYRVIL